MPIVRIPTPLRAYTNGQDVVEVQGTTVRAALGDLTTIFPDLLERLFEGQDLRRFINAFVQDEDIRYLNELETPVTETDEINLIPAVAGG